MKNVQMQDVPCVFQGALSSISWDLLRSICVEGSNSRPPPVVKICNSAHGVISGS